MRLSLFFILFIGVYTLQAANKIQQILFAGSSSTYFHDLPGQVATLLNEHDPAGLSWEASIAGRSGSSIHVYTEAGFDKYQYGVPKGQSFIEVVQNGSYDYLVMMAVNNFIHNRFPEKHNKALDLYTQTIREAGGIPVIYEMGWKSGSETQIEGNKEILKAAIRNKIRIYAPCSRAWARVRKEKPEIELHNLPDTVHPGIIGTYLNLCCFYAAFTRSNPMGLQHNFYAWKSFKNKAEKENAFTNLTHDEVQDSYVKKLPNWLKMNFMLREKAKLDKTTSAYLEKVAWETWLEIDKKLENAGVPLAVNL